MNAIFQQRNWTNVHTVALTTVVPTNDRIKLFVSIVTSTLILLLDAF